MTNAATRDTGSNFVGEPVVSEFWHMIDDTRMQA